MRRKVLDVLKLTKMIRQRMSMALQPDNTFKEQPDVGGRTYDAFKTVIIFDSGLNTDASQFFGGHAGSGVLAEDVQIFTHEFGHVVGGRLAVESKFDAFVAKHGIKPFTKYSTKQVAAGEQRDFFAEAFLMYQTDPEWMLTNYPLLHAWFETLVKTGKPPVQ